MSFSSTHIYSKTATISYYENYWVYCLGALGCLVDHCPTKFLVAFRFFKHVCYLALSCWTKFLLDSCKDEVIIKISLLLSESESGGRVDFFPTGHLIHNNQFFTIPEDRKLDLFHWQRIPEKFLYAILRVLFLFWKPSLF